MFTYKQLTEEDLPTLAPWFLDPWIKENFEYLLPLEEFFRDNSGRPTRRLELVMEGNKTVALVDFDSDYEGEPNTGCMDILINPDRSREEYLAQVLKDYLATKLPPELTTMKSEFWTDDTLYRKVYEQAGYINEGPILEDLFLYSYACK